jgi:hypothetical protein
MAATGRAGCQMVPAAVIGALIGAGIGFVVGGIAGFFIGGEIFPDFEWGGYRGYEAVPALSGPIGAVLGGAIGAGIAILGAGRITRRGG